MEIIERLDLEILLKDRLQLQVPVKIKTSQTKKNEDILKEKAKSIPQYHHYPLTTLLPRVDLVTRPPLESLPPLSIPLAALLATGPAIGLEFGAEGAVRRRRACGL
jgi:hypothetical protein